MRGTSRDSQRTQKKGEYNEESVSGDMMSHTYIVIAEIEIRDNSYLYESKPVQADSREQALVKALDVSPFASYRGKKVKKYTVYELAQRTERNG